MKKIELNIVALAKAESSAGNYVLVLEEQNGTRRVPLIIGAFEAQAIAVALEKIETERPTTHQLFKKTLVSAGILLQEIVIYDLQNETFYAKLVGKKADESPLEVDSRSSDAIALSIYFGCSIFIAEKILQQVGIISEKAGKHFPKNLKNLSEYSLAELQVLLKDVLKKEDYENASKIRDAIKKKE